MSFKYVQACISEHVFLVSATCRAVCGVLVPKHDQDSIAPFRSPAR